MKWSCVESDVWSVMCEVHGDVWSGVCTGVV